MGGISSMLSSHFLYDPGQFDGHLSRGLGIGLEVHYQQGEVEVH
jgi:hypothetical protein